VFDHAELKLVQLFLTAPTRGVCPTLEEMGAWILFHRAHTVLIRAVLKRSGLRSGEADDLMQQVWIVLLKRLPTWQFDPATGTLEGYIGKIAARLARRHVRRRQKRPSGVFTAALESMLTDPGHGPLAEYERNERNDRARAILAAARASLPEEAHRMLVMRFIDGRGVGEIAAAFSVSFECARKKLQRAIQGIRALTVSKATL
jgi:RNA polymerase sigma factor (sigma-70 family)